MHQCINTDFLGLETFPFFLKTLPAPRKKSPPLYLLISFHAAAFTPGFNQHLWRSSHPSISNCQKAAPAIVPWDKRRTHLQWAVEYINMSYMTFSLMFSFSCKITNIFIRHTWSVYCWIRSEDEDQIISCGCESSMCVWDTKINLVDTVHQGIQNPFFFWYQ